MSAAARTGNGSLVWVLLALLAGAGLALALAGPRGQIAAPSDSVTVAWSPAPRPEGAVATLRVDFGNGARRELLLPWRPGMTVGDLLAAAADFRPAVTFTHRGAGDMTFLTSLEGVANEGADGRSWLYRIDDQLGDRSFAVAEVPAGATVLWEFRRGE
ncbi:MAG TPA: DUF4430 domain-containing protein [Lacipirellulaceae bacterium]|nr:DUF4430 domain-containing protein [Lacipirellulaceae bacterium]